MSFPDEQSDGPDPALRIRQALDALVYGVAVVGVLVVGSALVSFPVGGGWVGVKYVLFFVGFFLFGLSAFQLRPKPAWKRDDGENGNAANGNGTSGERAETRFQALVQRLPPLGRYGLAPDDRLSPAAKLFVASVLVLLVSFLMESAFGIAA